MSESQRPEVAPFPGEWTAVWAVAAMTVVALGWWKFAAHLRDHPIHDELPRWFFAWAVGGLGALILIGIIGGVALRPSEAWPRRFGVLLAAAAIAVFIPTLVVAQAQARYDTGCLEYKGSKPPPRGQTKREPCDVGFAFGAVIGTAAQMIPVAFGLGIGIGGRGVMRRHRKEPNDRRDD